MTGLRERLRIRRAMRQPIVVDEDGAIRVAVLRPGESVHATVEDGRPTEIRVLTADGRIRQEWPVDNNEENR